MTQIDITTDIPSNINTLERLATWAIISLQQVNPTLKVIEVSQEAPVHVAQAALVQADDGTIRFFGRVSIPMADDYAADNSVKLWMKSEEFGNIALPAAYKQD